MRGKGTKSGGKGRVVLSAYDTGTGVQVILCEVVHECVRVRRVHPGSCVFGKGSNKTCEKAAFQRRFRRCYSGGRVMSNDCVFGARSCERALTARFCSRSISVRAVQSCLKRFSRRVAGRCISFVPEEVRGTDSACFGGSRGSLTSAVGIGGHNSEG